MNYFRKGVSYARAAYKGSLDPISLGMDLYEAQKAIRNRKTAKSYKAFVAANKKNPAVTRRVGGPTAARAPYRRKGMYKPKKATTIADPGGYQQHTVKSIKAPIGSRRKLMSTIVKANTHYVRYIFQGVKEFDNHGYYWMSNTVDGLGVRTLPLYMFDLTAAQNANASGNIIYSQPFVRAFMNNADGKIFFQPVNGLTNDGVTLSPNLQVETAPSAFAIAGAGYYPSVRDILSSINIKLNLWGASHKGTQFYVQIVSISENDLIPSHLTEASTSQQVTSERTAFYQGLLKHLTFNPITSSSTIHSRKLKIIRTWKVEVDPAESSENDPDPHVKTLKISMPIQRMVTYTQTAGALNTGADFAEQADYAINTGHQLTAQTDARRRLYLMIRASNYGTDVENSNVNTPSFDMVVRLQHKNLN